MRAFVMKAIGQVGFMEKPIPHAGPNDAIIKMTMALICTSDSHTVGEAIGPRENLTLGPVAPSQTLATMVTVILSTFLA